MAYRRYAKGLIALGLLWTFGVTLLRGLRRPNDWAEAHWLISYEFGLLKRALPATLIRPLLALAPQQAELIITVVSSLITALLCLALLAVCLTILRRAAFSPNAVLVVAACLTSPFIVMTGHLNGYFDGLIILLSIAATALTLRGRPWPAAVLLTVGLLIHETIFVIGFPTVLWAALLRPDVPQHRQSALARLWPFLLPLVVFVALFAYQSFAVDAAALEQTLIARLETYAFIEYDQEVIVPRAFAKGFVAHFRSQSGRVWGRLFAPGMMIAALPTVLLLLLYTRAVLRAGNTRRGLIALGLLLPFLPLSLHLIAWDTPRIWTYPIVVALLAVWVAVRVVEPARVRAINSTALNILGLLVLPLNAFIRIPLMDWRVERFATLARVALYLPLPAALFVAFARRRSADYTKATIES